MAWLLSTLALPSRQVNMADSCERIFHLFERHHSKSSIFERMENILSDCCHSWTENPSNNSCSRQLTIVNAVVMLIASRVRSIDRSLFLQTQATHFETVITTVDEVSNNTKVPHEFILHSVLLDCFTAELDE